MCSSGGSIVDLVKPGSVTNLDYFTRLLNFLAEGCFPSDRHDFQPWSTLDAGRAGKAGMAFAFKAALLYIKGEGKGSTVLSPIPLYI